MVFFDWQSTELHVRLKNGSSRFLIWNISVSFAVLSSSIVWSSQVFKIVFFSVSLIIGSDIWSIYLFSVLIYLTTNLRHWINLREGVYKGINSIYHQYDQVQRNKTRLSKYMASFHKRVLISRQNIPCEAIARFKFIWIFSNLLFSSWFSRK